MTFIIIVPNSGKKMLSILIIFRTVFHQKMKISLDTWIYGIVYCHKKYQETVLSANMLEGRYQSPSSLKNSLQGSPEFGNRLDYVVQCCYGWLLTHFSNSVRPTAGFVSEVRHQNEIWKKNFFFGDLLQNLWE